MLICILLLGGTISKVSNDHFDNGYIGALLAQSRISPSVETKVVELFSRDSTTFTDEEIAKIACAVNMESAVCDGIVMLMGTDGMISVSRRLKTMCNVNVPVAISGSIIPYRWGISDAVFNFASALGVAQRGQPGLWICMNGLVLEPEHAEKNYEKQMFTG